MGDVLQLLDRKVSSETISKLARLLLEAQAGKLIGIALVAWYGGVDYDVDAAGETRRCPTITRGMLCKLDDELAALIRDGKLP